LALEGTHLACEVVHHLDGSVGCAERSDLSVEVDPVSLDAVVQVDQRSGLVAVDAAGCGFHLPGQLGERCKLVYVLGHRVSPCWDSVDDQNTTPLAWLSSDSLKAFGS
jgi:hypothetical protein